MLSSIWLLFFVEVGDFKDYVETLTMIVKTKFFELLCVLVVEGTHVTKFRDGNSRVHFLGVIELQKLACCKIPPHLG